MLFSWFIHLTRVLCPFFSSSFILSSLHLFSTEVLPESVLSYSSFLTECLQLCSYSLHSFFQFVQPLKVLWFHCLSRINLVLPLLFFFRCPSGAILDLGTRSSRSGGALWRPETDVPGVFQLFDVFAMSFACVLHLVMSSCALHHHVFETCICSGLLVLSVVCSEPRHTCTRTRHVQNIILWVAGKMFSKWFESWRVVLL